MKVLILASGRGSNFEAILKASKNGTLSVDVVGLVCDRECNAINIANSGSVPVSVLKPKDYNSKDEYTKKLIEIVGSYNPDYIILAGYMRIVPSELIDLYPLKIINIHPSLLPEFKGKDAIKQAWDAGVKTTGVTVHFVNDKMDAGLIISQEKVPVPSTLESLEENIHKVEHVLYIKAIKMLTQELKCAIVSKCLMGENVRYDGGNKYSKRVETFINNFKGVVLKVCPELDAGLGVPRNPMDIINGKVISRTGQDLSQQIESTCKRIVRSIDPKIKTLAVLKDRSPSCGKSLPYGMFAETLIKELGENVLVVTEEEI